METLSTVFVVGDARDLRERLERISAGGRFAVRWFATADDALDFCAPDMPGCFVLDQQIAGSSGLLLQEQLGAKGCQQPFIYLSRDHDVASAVTAMHHGAVDCIELPLDCERLQRCIEEALARDEDVRRSQAERAEVLACVASLTPRERQILEFVAAGEITKSIARLLSISPKTVEVHRSNIMRKMHVDSAAALLHLVAKYALFPFAAEVCRTSDDRVVNESARTEGQRSAGSSRCGSNSAPAAPPRGMCRH